MSSPPLQYIWSKTAISLDFNIKSFFLASEPLSETTEMFAGFVLTGFLAL